MKSWTPGTALKTRYQCTFLKLSCIVLLSAGFIYWSFDFLQRASRTKKTTSKAKPVQLIIEEEDDEIPVTKKSQKRLSVSPKSFWTSVFLCYIFLLLYIFSFVHQAKYFLSLNSYWICALFYFQEETIDSASKRLCGNRPSEATSRDSGLSSVGSRKTRGSTLGGKSVAVHKFRLLFGFLC